MLAEGFPVEFVRNSDIALPLGHHWVPFPDQILEPVAIEPPDTGSDMAWSHETEARLQNLEQACRPVYDRILRGGQGTMAERLLHSIPGIGGEKLDLENLILMLDLLNEDNRVLATGTERLHGRILGPSLPFSLRLEPALTASPVCLCVEVGVVGEG